MKFLLLLSTLLFFCHPGHAQTWQSLFNQADSLNGAGQVNAALAIGQQAEKQAQTEFGGRHYHTAQTSLMLGSILLQQGKYAAAETKLIAARNLLGQVAPDSVIRVEAFNYLGILYRNQARYAAADSSIREALRLSTLLPTDDRRKYRAYTLGNLASLYRLTLETRRAEPLLVEALAIQDSLTGKLNQEYASYLSGLASVYNSLQQHTRAEPLYLEALAIYRQLFRDTHPRVALVMNNLAIYYLDLGDTDKALTLLLNVKAIREKTGAKGRDYLLTLQNLAVCYEDKKQYDRADSLYVQVLTTLEKEGNRSSPSYINALQNRATQYRNQAKYSEACQLFDEAINLAKSTISLENELYARLLSNAAVSYLALGNVMKADTLNSAALAIADRVLGKKTISYAVYLLVQGQIKCTPAPTKEGIDLLEASLTGLENNFNQNFLTMTPNQKIAFVNRWMGHYSRYFSVIMASAATVQVAAHPYTVALSLKNMLLNEHSQLLSALGQAGDKLIINRLDSLRKTKDQLATQYIKPITQRQHVDSLEARAETLEKALARQSAPFRQAQQSLRVRWEDIRNALKPHEAAVEFVSFAYNNGRQQTDSVRYMALVLRPGDKAPVVVPLLTDEAPLRQLLARKTAPATTGKYATRGSEVDTDQLTRGDSLYRLIWQPIDRLLTGVKTVYLAPSGLLHQVAFAALPYHDSHNKTTRYLTDRYQLRQVGSTRQVVTQNRDASIYQSLTSARLYGGIQYDSSRAPLLASAANSLMAEHENQPGLTTQRSGSWPYLPGTKREVEQIRALIGPKASLVSGSIATETAVKALSGQSPTVLHIATHGFTFPDPGVTVNDSSGVTGGNQFRRIANPLLRTGLLMAGANRVWQGGRPALGEDDGILTAYEVANLNLSATKLVVLSACETALGDIRGSEGVFGLQRAFKMAGVDYLLMSLWPVSDALTSDLMTQFYHNWQRHRAIRAAFEQTQTQMRQKYPPAVWAAFVLIE